QALAARARQQAVVSELGQQALGGMPLVELMDEAVRQVAQTLDVDLCKVLELLPRGDSLLLTAAVGWPRDAINHLTVPNTRESQAGFTLHLREPVIVEDWHSDPRFGGLAYHSHGAVSGVSVVIEGGGKPYGVL